MDSPTWRTIKGEGNCVTCDNTWLYAHAVEWYFSRDDGNLTLHYLALDPMPLIHATMQTVTGNPSLTPEQEDMVRRIVAEEIKKVEKRLVSLTVYELGQRMASMKQVRGEK